MKHDPAKWKADYDRDGYVVVENLVDPETLKRMRDALDTITDAPRKLPEYLQRYVHFEDDYLKKRPQHSDLPHDKLGDAIRIIMELPRFDRVFEDLILYNPLLDVLQTLFASSEFHFHNFKCVVKAPFVSSRFCWHRDLPYLFHTTPNLITAMLCVDDMTEENGATVVMPGTHRVPEDYCDVAEQDIPEEKLPAGERVTVCCPAGSAVLFHVNIIHGGGANRSPVPRRNVISIWGGPDTHPIKLNRYAHQGISPRSTNPSLQKQVRMTFPWQFERPAPTVERNDEPTRTNARHLSGATA